MPAVSATLSLHDALPIFDVRRRREYRFGVALAVDQLQHTDHVLLVILHRDDQHGLGAVAVPLVERAVDAVDRKSTRLNSSHLGISYAVFCLKKKRSTVLA